MATAHLGTLNAFNSAEEPITSYLECVQLFFTANSVDEGKQVPTFLSTVGPATYAILQDLFAPALPSSVPLTDIFESLKDKIVLSNLTPSNPVLDVGKPTTQPKTANLRMLLAMPVGRRATLPQPADLSL